MEYARITGRRLWIGSRSSSNASSVLSLIYCVCRKENKAWARNTDPFCCVSGNASARSPRGLTCVVQSKCCDHEPLAFSSAHHDALGHAEVGKLDGTPLVHEAVGALRWDTVEAAAQIALGIGGGGRETGVRPKHTIAFLARWNSFTYGLSAYSHNDESCAR